MCFTVYLVFRDVYKKWRVLLLWIFRYLVFNWWSILIKPTLWLSTIRLCGKHAYEESAVKWRQMMWKLQIRRYYMLDSPLWLVSKDSTNVSWHLDVSLVRIQLTQPVNQCHPFCTRRRPVLPTLLLLENYDSMTVAGIACLFGLLEIAHWVHLDGLEYSKPNGQSCEFYRRSCDKNECQE